ncbi:hypothetical protein ACHHRT_13475, partial [Desulfurivibrio sp. D14AmB]|uniref:hypothetical protein n=1 Tax=Desulfurivibrio sp. D14AmB TaxID=3374370 RepID=UPI00376EE63D
MNRWALRLALTILLLLLLKPVCWAATGFVNIDSPNPGEQICLEDKLVISGQFMLETDDTPRGSADPAIYCNAGAQWAILSPQCCSSPWNFTSLHARLLY